MRKEIKYGVDLANSRNGHGSVFNRNNSEDKAMVEGLTLQEFAKALPVHFGIDADVQVNENDPPDGFAKVNGQCLTVELVQLVTPEHVVRAKNGESPYQGELFKDAQWSAERLEKAINALIAKKSKLYTKCGRDFDILLIHSDEPWLTPQDVKSWLPNMAFERQTTFDRIFLLLTYDPASSGKAWPLFQLSGRSFSAGRD